MMKIAIFILALLLAVSCVPVLGAKDKPPEPKIINVPIAERPSIAIMTFDDGSLQRQDWWGPSWDVGSGLADILTTVMLDRNRYRLLERSLMDKVIAEQDLGAAGRLDPTTAAKIGKIIGADYLIMGKVTDFSWDKKTSGIIIPIGGLGGIGGSKTKAHVAIDLRIVDSTTAEILGSYAGKGEESRSDLIIAHEKIGGLLINSSDFLGTILGKATNKALAQWCDNLCIAQDQNKLNLISKNKPVMRPDGAVIYVDGLTVIANTGTSKGYMVGDQIEIRRKGKELTDPDTGEVLRVLSDLIGTGTVTKVDEKTADITFTLIDPANGPMDGDMVTCAAPSTPPPSPPAQPSEPESQQSPSGD